MKKFSIILFLALAVLVSNISMNYNKSYAESNRTMQAQVKSKRLVEGTRFHMQMLNDASTLKGVEGDSFDSVLTEDIKVDETVMLPVGTVVRGSLAKINPPRRLSRGALLYVDFDHVVTTEGRQLPISAALCSIKNLNLDGSIIGGGNYGYALKQNVKKSGEIIKNSTDWGISVGEDKLGGYLQYITTPVAFLGGSLGGGVYLIGDSVVDLFRKGQDVTIPKGTNFTIMLLKDLDVPVNY